MSTQFTIGCDPEFFLKDKDTNELISAIPFVSGTKHAPMVLPKGGNIQRDNVAVEVATDPADDMDKFVRNIENTLSEAVKTLPTNTEIVAIPSACFNEKQLEHLEAKAFGCDPDYDVWTLSVNEKPHASDATFRSCGAHIHVGTTGEDENAFLLEMEGKFSMVKAMDCFHGLISTILDSSKEAIDRRQLYGKAGAHRPKEYGVEYRVLSNYWLKSPVTVMMVYSLTQDALRIVREAKIDKLIGEIGDDTIIGIINKGDSEAAMKVVEAHILPLLSEDSVHYFREAMSKKNVDFHTEWKLYGKGESK